MIYNRNRLYSRAIHCPTSMGKNYVQWFLLKSVYDITDCAKIRFFPSWVWVDQAMVPGFGISAECPIFWAFIPRMWFPYSYFQHVWQPSIPSPVEEDTQKIRDTTVTVFIQGPSIVLPVWICIMFNGSYLRACMKLWFVKKLDFPFMSLGGPSHGALVWCLGRVPKHRN